MPLPPSLTDEQRRQALAKAAEARKRRAAIKEDLRGGRLTLEALLKRKDDDVVGKMKISTALEALPGVGKVRAERILDRLNLYAEGPDGTRKYSRRLRGLGAKQRESLLKEFTTK